MSSQERIRLTITVSPEVHEVFSRMAETAGVSLGRCMGDWLADTIDGAQFVATKMAEARAAPKTVMREMHAAASGLLAEVRSETERLRASGWRPGSASAVAPPLPPSSLTGGKSPAKKARKP